MLRLGSWWPLRSEGESAILASDSDGAAGDAGLQESPEAENHVEAVDGFNGSDGPTADIASGANCEAANGSHGAGDTTSEYEYHSAQVEEELSDDSIPSTLPLTGDTQNAPEDALSSDFWEEAAKHDKTLQGYIPSLLASAADYFNSTRFTDITSAMNNIVHATATFRNSIQGALDARNITIAAFTRELDTIFTGIAHKLQDISHPETAPGHAERQEMVERVLDETEMALTNLAERYGIGAEVVTTYLLALRPQVHRLTVAAGDINERHPQLLPTLTFSVAGMLIPETWILKPFLTLLGFGPAGPIKGSAAAWMQRYFWGAAVKAGSWFSFLQAAGMGVIPGWTKLAMKVPGLLWMALPYFKRTTATSSGP